MLLVLEPPAEEQGSKALGTLSPDFLTVLKPKEKNGTTNTHTFPTLTNY